MSGDETKNTASEPVPIQDTYITAVHRVEFLGRNNVRIHLYAEEDGQRVIVGKIIMAIDDIPGSIATLLKATVGSVTRLSLLEVQVANRVGRH